MNLKPRELAILKSIAHIPRTAHRLTHSDNGVADVQCSANVIQSYLDRMHEAGLIELGRRQSYSITAAGLELLQREAQVVPSRYFGNATMTEAYRPPKVFVRAGAEDHRQYRSLGVGA